MTFAGQGFKIEKKHTHHKFIWIYGPLVNGWRSGMLITYKEKTVSEEAQYSWIAPGL